MPRPSRCSSRQIETSRQTKSNAHDPCPKPPILCPELGESRYRANDKAVSDARWIDLEGQIRADAHYKFASQSPGQTRVAGSKCAARANTTRWVARPAVIS